MRINKMYYQSGLSNSENSKILSIPIQIEIE